MLGLCLALLVAFFGSITSVLNRTLKEIPASLIMFYHSLSGVIVMIIVILIEAALSSENTIRMFTYTRYQFMILIVATVFNAITVYTHTKAF